MSSQVHQNLVGSFPSAIVWPSAVTHGIQLHRNASQTPVPDQLSTMTSCRREPVISPLFTSHFQPLQLHPANRGRVHAFFVYRCFVWKREVVFFPFFVRALDVHSFGRTKVPGKRSHSDCYCSLFRLTCSPPPSPALAVVRGIVRGTQPSPSYIFCPDHLVARVAANRYFGAARRPAASPLPQFGSVRRLLVPPLRLSRLPNSRLSISYTSIPPYYPLTLYPCATLPSQEDRTVPQILTSAPTSCRSAQPSNVSSSSPTPSEAPFFLAPPVCTIPGSGV